jgi:hypothetical protein
MIIQLLSTTSVENIYFATSEIKKNNRIMDVIEMQQLSVAEMSQIKGGKWVWIKDQWYWIETLDLDEDD